MALYPSTVQSAFPAIWARDLQVALRKVLVYADVCNRKYEGEIANMGDTVRVQTVADISIGDYTRDTVVSGQSLTTTDIVLAITQGKTFNFKWDFTNQKQSAVKDIMEEAMSRSAYQMRDGVDQFIAETIDDGVATANTLTAVTDIGNASGETDPYDVLVDLNVQLTQNNVPPDGRWCVVPPWYMGEIAKMPARFSFGTPDNLRVFSEGYVGIDRITGFRMYQSNNVPVTGTATPTEGAYSVLAGYTDAVTFANQVTRFKQAEQPDAFYTNNLGLMLYGALTTRPIGLAKVEVTKAA